MIMKQIERDIFLSRNIVTLAGMVVVLLLVGCSDHDKNSGISNDPRQTKTIERAPPSPAQPVAVQQSIDLEYNVAPRLKGKLEEDGFGLEFVIDAASRRVFAESLRGISQDVSKIQMEQLNTALRYIHTYDPTVMAGQEKLLQRVDGMTGQEVIDLAARVAQQRRQK